MGVMSIQGKSNGHIAGIDENGNVLVAARRPAMERSANVGGSVSTTGAELVPEADGRQSITFMVTGTNGARLKFGTSAPGNDDLLLGPGERLTLDVVGDDAVWAKAVGGDTFILCMEWILKPPVL